MLKKQFLIFLTVFLYSLEGHVSRVYNEDLTITDAVNRSEMVAIVVPVKPFKSEEKTVLMKAKDEDKQDVVFKTFNLHFKVSKILFKDQVKIKEGDSIKVLEMNSMSKMEVFRLYHIEGQSKSPLYKVYNSKTEFKIDEPRIIALRYFVDEADIEKYELTAVEGIAYQQDFQNAIKIR